jgi:hypothetical protein
MTVDWWQIVLGVAGAVAVLLLVVKSGKGG